MLPIYVAVVVESGVGEGERGIRVKNQYVPKSSGIVYPALDGLLKTPVPEVDDMVIVLCSDDWNLGRYYIPILKQFSSISSSKTATQIEAAQIDLAADTINVGLGGESAVLGDTLVSTLNSFVSSVFNSHTHTSGAPGAPTSPPIVPATTDFSSAKSTVVKIK